MCVCVCVCVCTLSGLIAEHKFQVWVTILGYMSRPSCPLCFKKIKKNSLTHWYKEYTRKLEHSWKKTKIELFSWKDSISTNIKAINTT